MALVDADILPSDGCSVPIKPINRIYAEADAGIGMLLIIAIVACMQAVYASRIGF